VSSPSLSPGPGDRARYWLRCEHDQPDAVIAKMANASKTTVLRARKQLEAQGTIPVRDPGLSDDAAAWSRQPPREVSHAGSGRGLTPAQRAQLELEADPRASNSRIAERARCGRTTVLEARRYLEDSGLIIMFLAADRERRGRLQSPDWWGELTPQPASLVSGLCASHPDPDLWHPGKHNPARQQQAIRICLTPCPVLADCRAWSLQLPTTDKGSIYGGLSSNQRVKLRRQREREAAQPASAGTAVPLASNGRELEAIR
jgi:hypothetical protein